MTRAIVMTLILATAAIGCTTTGTTPSLSVTTLMPDSERWFKLSWEAIPEKTGDLRRLRGYVENTYGEAAARVQLLAQALDTNGALVGQKISWVSGVVPGFGRTYFEIPDMPTADTYRVTVWAYERIQGRDGFVIQR
jgi:hypothetical protein